MAFSGLKSFWNQSFRIPAPPLTDKNLPDQTGKVHVVTGGYAGVGQELVRILYSKNATVYVAGRSLDKANISISATKFLFPSSKGRIEFLKLDLADSSTIKKSAEEFMAKESRLDVLVNNAGVMFPPAGEKDAQGHELQMGTNVLGHFLFAELLVPILKNTAAISPRNTVRVIWAGSLGIQIHSPENGVQFNADGTPVIFKSQQSNYGQSKTANLYLAQEFSRQYGNGKGGIVSVCFNPGNLRTELKRHAAGGVAAVVSKAMLYPAVYGAYTELYAGWSESVTGEGPLYVIPWGRDGGNGLSGDVRKWLEVEGEDGVVRKLWSWCEKETKSFR